MTPQKFTIGQLVDFDTRIEPTPRTKGPYQVLRVLPATRRVQILLDILGGPTSVEVDRASVVLERNTVADRMPILAASPREKLRV